MIRFLRQFWQILIEKEGDAEFRNTLHVALKYGARQCVDYLLEKPANFNSQVTY